MKNILLVITVIVAIKSNDLYSQSGGFFTNFNPPDLPGERKISIDVELRGLDISRYTVTCYYSTDSMEVARALDPTKRTGREPSAIAKSEVIKNDNSKMRCSIILPHYKHPTPNNGDLNPRQIGAPNKVYCGWVRSNQIQGARESLTIPSHVLGFKVPRLLVIAYTGDSYASGEGAPNAFDALNKYNRWNNDDGIDCGCHRSEKSGGARAIRKLRTEHPEWAIKYVNVTCSGALVQDIYTYRLRESNMTLKAQLEQIKDKIGSRTTVDILLSDGGGNDAGLVGIGSSALTDFLGDICNDRNIQNTIKIAIDGLPRRYEDLATAIESEHYGYKVGKVVWFNYPSPLTAKDGKLCSAGTNGINPLDCWGLLEEQVSDCDWQWIRDNIFPKINEVIKKAVSDNKWDLVDISNRAFKHGMCNCDEPYFNTLGQSLLTQFDERGTMHPNATGFREIYEDPINDQLEKSIKEYHSNLNSKGLATIAIDAKIKPSSVNRFKDILTTINKNAKPTLEVSKTRKDKINLILKETKSLKPKVLTKDMEPIKKETDNDNKEGD